MRRTVSISFTILLAIGIAFSVALYSVSEARAATYSQTVDNSTSGRFSASSRWIFSNYHPDTNWGSNNRVLKKPLSISDNARFKINIPAKASYKIYARWPSDPGYNDKTRFYINTAAGWKTKPVSQRTNGGKWVLLGTYTMNKADSYSIQVGSQSSGKGYIIADAVKVVKATTTTSTAGSGGVTGTDIVAEARRQIGDPYVFGAAGPDAFDCSGLTMYVYKKVAGISLPHSAKSQYSYGTSVSRSGLKPGDLIFGNAGGSGIQHVGIYAGKDSNGNRLMIHAGNEQTDVEITTYESWYTEIGYKRLIR